MKIDSKSKKKAITCIVAFAFVLLFLFIQKIHFSITTFLITKFMKTANPLSLVRRPLTFHTVIYIFIYFLRLNTFLFKSKCILYKAAFVEMLLDVEIKRSNKCFLYFKCKSLLSFKQFRTFIFMSSIKSFYDKGCKHTRKLVKKSYYK